jgi:AraC family transcriptional regulator of arabinose operon
MWEFAWAHVHARPAWIPWLAWPQRAPGLRILAVPDPAAFAAIAARFQEAHHHACSARHHRHELALNALEEVLLRADEHNAASPAGRDGRLDPRLRAAIDRCLRDLAAPWDIARLAQAAGLSPSRFAHLFRSELGESPRRFLERHRIDRARHLLRATAAPVAGIAHEVGFPDPFHFSIRFRACTGRSPSAWRAGA